MTAHSNTYLPAEPVPLLRETPCGAAYPIEAFGPLQGAAEAIHDITQAPLAICAQSVLGVASLAAQGLADAETLHGRAPCSLFLVTVAQSGERKSACDRLAMAPVKDFEQELADSSKAEATAHKNRMELWKADRQRVLAAKKPKAEREANLAALGPEPEPPLYATVVSADPTLQGITKNMKQLPASLGIFSDEGGGFLGGYGMTSDNQLSTISGLSGLWDGTSVTRWRAQDGVMAHPGRRLSMHIMAQPIVAETLLANPVAQGQGFLARCLVTAPVSAIGTRTRIGHDPRSDCALGEFNAVIGALLRRPLPLRPDTRNELAPPLLGLTPEARHVLSEFALRVEEAQIDGGELATVRPFASKAAEHAARIAAVLTICAGGPEVSQATMEGAVELAAYYVKEATRLMDAAVISRETADAERMRCWLKKRWSEDFISAGDAAQRGPFQETAKARRALLTLERHGYLVPAEGGAEILGQRRREAWHVVRSGA